MTAVIASIHMPSSGSTAYQKAADPDSPRLTKMGCCTLSLTPLEGRHPLQPVILQSQIPQENLERELTGRITNIDKKEEIPQCHPEQVQPSSFEIIPNLIKLQLGTQNLQPVVFLQHKIHSGNNVNHLDHDHNTCSESNLSKLGRGYSKEQTHDRDHSA